MDPELAKLILSPEADNIVIRNGEQLEHTMVKGFNAITYAQTRPHHLPESAVIIDKQVPDDSFE